MANRAEILQILTIVEVAFPATFQNMDQRKAKALAGLWTEMFQDTDKDELSYAVKHFIANNTNGFPPSVGQINEIISGMHDEGITEVEAWQMIRRAIQKAGGDREYAQKAYDELPESVKAPIKPHDLIEWGYMNSDTVNTVISSAYRKSFNTKQKRAKELQALPQSVKNLLTFKSIGE